MPITDQLRSLARHEYGVVRGCLTVLERRVVDPCLGSGAGAAVGRVRDSLDDLVERIVGHPHERSDTAGENVGDVTDADATTADATTADATTADATTADAATADGAPEQGRTEGSAVLSTVKVTEVEELAEEYLEAEHDHLTGELAENGELRRVQAELRAKHTLQENDEDGRH